MNSFKVVEEKRDEGELYKRMYYLLFNAITDAINIKEKVVADELLRQAQIKTEEIFVD